MRRPLKGGLCSVCLEWTRYRAGADGFSEVRGTQVRVVRGDFVCLHHPLVDDRGRQLTIEELAVA